MRRSVITALCTVCLVALAGCSSAPHRRGASSSPRAGSDAPVGIVAVGHSGLTGYASDPMSPMSTAYANSWATGTNPTVDSIYQRMVRAEPRTAGHAVNAAVNGSKVDDIQAQLASAFTALPHPQLIIVQTIDNDITCDGTDPTNELAFGKTLLAALRYAAQRSPGTTILTIAEIGRPAEAFRAIADVPEAVAASEGTGMCAAFDPAGHLQADHLATLATILEGYEAQAAQACAQVPQCRYSDTSARYTDSVANFAGDYQHLSIAGHRAFAALMWPDVASILGLPD